jgi:hypothetical protein
MVQDTLVSLTRVHDDDYISLTDIARVRNPDEPKDVVKNWLRNRATSVCVRSSACMIGLRIPLRKPALRVHLTQRSIFFGPNFGKE